MPETKITRKQVVTVESVNENSYHDLLFTAGGKEYKISNKRIQYFTNIIQVGAEVELGFAEAYNKEYIYSAIQTGTHTVPKEDHLVKAAKAMGAEVITEKPHNTKDRAVVLSYAKDLAVAGKIELKDMSSYADKFLEYINK